jgi:hypothetical protein
VKKVTYLFSTSPLSERLENHKINMIREIQSCEHDYLLNVSLDDYCEYLIAKYSEETPVINEQDLYLLRKEEVRKDGYEKPSFQRASMLTGDIDFVFAIPFSGNGALFQTRPRTSNSNPPSGNVKRTNEIEIHIRSKINNESGLKKQVKNQIKSMMDYLGWIETDVEQHNARALNRIARDESSLFVIQNKSIVSCSRMNNGLKKGFIRVLTFFFSFQARARVWEV